VRRLIVLVAVVGCAQVGAPPGGPPDNSPPHLLRISPDTNALNVRPRSVELRFDEVINERPARGGEKLDALFLVSPSRGRVDVDWHRSRIEIRPREGWRPNTTYTVTQLPGISDLRGNIDTSEHRYVFSTGPARATALIRGQVFDWAAGRPAPRAFVQAVHLPDSLTYAEYADSLGRFVIRYMIPGRYLLRAILDANNNRTLDRRELFDTATITLGDSVTREILAFVHDSVGAGIANVEPLDSLTLRVTFDRPLQPRVPVEPSQFSLKAADSSVVPITAVTLGSAFERARADSARAKAVQDSIRAAQVADSVRRANPRPAAPAPAPPVQRPPAAQRDTATPPLKPSVPIPESYVVLRLGRPLAPNTSYRLHADSLRSLTGVARSSDRVFTTPRAAPPDSGRADTTRPPAAPVRRPPDGDESASAVLRTVFDPAVGPARRESSGAEPRRPARAASRRVARP